MKQIVPSLAETQVKGTHSLQKLSNLFGKIKTFIMALKKKHVLIHISIMPLSLHFIANIFKS